MGGRRLEALALMGIGYRRLSITPAAVGPIKELVRKVDLAELTAAMAGWLADPSLKVEDLVLATDIPGLFVLPAGGQTTADSEWLASAQTAQVLDRLTQGAPGRTSCVKATPSGTPAVPTSWNDCTSSRSRASRQSHR